MNTTFVAEKYCKECTVVRKETVSINLLKMLALNKLRYYKKASSRSEHEERMTYYKDIITNNYFVLNFISSLIYYVRHLTSQLDISNAVTYDLHSILTSIVNDHMCIIKLHKKCKSTTKIGIENMTDKYKEGVFKCVHGVYIDGVDKNDRGKLIYFDIEKTPIGLTVIESLITITVMMENTLRRDYINSHPSIIYMPDNEEATIPYELNQDERLQNLIVKSSRHVPRIAADLDFKCIEIPPNHTVTPYPCLNNSNDSAVVFNQAVMWVREAYCFPQGTKSNVREHAEKIANKRNFEIIPPYLFEFLNLILKISKKPTIGFEALMNMIKDAELAKEQFSLESNVEHNYKYTMNNKSETFRLQPAELPQTSTSSKVAVPIE